MPQRGTVISTTSVGDERVMQTAEFLATVPLFSSLDSSELSRFAELLREKTFLKGSVILFEHDPGDALFILRQGRVKVEKVV